MCFILYSEIEHNVSGTGCFYLRMGTEPAVETLCTVLECWTKTKALKLVMLYGLACASLLSNQGLVCTHFCVHTLCLCAVSLYMPMILIIA
jgi:hypothetical protein